MTFLHYLFIEAESSHVDPDQSLRGQTDKGVNCMAHMLTFKGGYSSIFGVQKIKDFYRCNSFIVDLTSQIYR